MPMNKWKERRWQHWADDEGIRSSFDDENIVQRNVVVDPNERKNRKAIDQMNLSRDEHQIRFEEIRFLNEETRHLS